MDCCRIKMVALILAVSFIMAGTEGAVCGAGLSASDSKGASGTISGQIMIAAKQPMQHGIVLLFDNRSGPPPSFNLYWRVPDMIIPLDPDGCFSFAVPPGTYFLQAAQKNPDGEIGPAYEKEYLYFHGDDKGNAIPLNVVSGAELALGPLQAFLWSPDMVRRDKGITSVEGVVVDLDNKPVERVLVLAYQKGESSGRPVFISDRTDKGGRFQLRTSDGGTFYLKVRGVVGGGRPSSGEFLNATGEFEPLPVKLKKNERLQGVTLKVKKLSRPNEQGSAPAKQDWRILNH